MVTYRNPINVIEQHIYWLEIHIYTNPFKILVRVDKLRQNNLVDVVPVASDNSVLTVNEFDLYEIVPN